MGFGLVLNRMGTQNPYMAKPPKTSPSSKWYAPSEFDFVWPPKNVDIQSLGRSPHLFGNAGLADLRGLNLAKIKLREKFKTIEKTEE